MSESLVFDVALEVPHELRVGGRTWFRRPEFHVTTFTPDALAALSGLPEDALAALWERFRGELTAPRPVRFRRRPRT